MAKTYKLVTIQDLLQVPLERRAACFRDLEYGLALLDLAVGDDMPVKLPEGMTWTDDDNHSVTLDIGQEQLTLVVSDSQPAQAGADRAGG